MGIGAVRPRLFCFVSVISIGVAFAAPRLRVDQTAIGPIAVAVGSNAASQRITLKNIGDGTLSPVASSNVDWLVPTVGSSYGCDLVATCLPVDVQVKTAALAKGVYTGIVTITAPGALDAPQTVTITVAVGGNVPDQVSMYVPVGGTATQSFQTSSTLTTSATPPANGPTLALALSGAGSFGTTRTYNITSTAGTGVPAGVYNGTVTTSGSPVPTENKTIPVTLTVTSQPIASIGDVAPFKIAQGTAQQNPHYVLVSNTGSGTLTLGDISATTSSGGNWLSASAYGPYIAVSANPAGLSAGQYTGTVTVNTNAANSKVTLPVTLNVVAPAAPLAYVGGLVDAATYTPYQPFARGDLPALFGEQFTSGTVYSATTLPLQTSVNGTTVYLNDSPVPIYYMSAEQINFQVPYDAKVGPGVLRVDRNGQRGNDIFIEIQSSRPKLLAATNLVGQALAGALAPSLLPIKRREDLVLYALGLGPTSPAVASGAASPSSPLAIVPTKPGVAFGTGDPASNGGITVTPDFVGLTPGLVGLYQINLKVPAEAPTGPAVPVTLTGALGTSNALKITIQ